MNYCLSGDKENKGLLSHSVALPFTLKIYLKAKRRIMETQIFHHAKKYNLQKKPSKRNQNTLKML
jgi:hypothetical protein